MTTSREDYTKRDVYKSLIYNLCNMLIGIREDPECRNLGLPIKLKLKEFETLFEYTGQNTKEAKIVEIGTVLKQLNEDMFGENDLTAITIQKPAILDDFLNNYNDNKEIIIGCSVKRLKGYQKELKSSTPKRKTKKELKAEEEVEEIIEKISTTIRKKYPDIELKLNNGKGSLQLKKGGVLKNMGGYNTRTYQMTKYILAPSSKSKKVKDVFEAIRINRDVKRLELREETMRAYWVRKEIILASIVELQKDKFLKGHLLEPTFNDKNKTVAIIFK